MVRTHIPELAAVPGGPVTIRGPDVGPYVYFHLQDTFVLSKHSSKMAPGTGDGQDPHPGVGLGSRWSRDHPGSGFWSI